MGGSRRDRRPGWWFWFPFLMGAMFAVIGIGFLFVSVIRLTGFIFLGIATVCFVVAFRIRRDITQADPPEVLPGVLAPDVENQVERRGVAGQGEIQSFKYLGQTHEQATLVELALTVTGVAAPVTTRAYIPLTLVDRLAAGAVVPLHYDPADPSTLVADWTRLPYKV